MRDKMPADVELSTAFISLKDVELDGACVLTIESVPNGKFNRVTKITIALPNMSEAIVIVPKERKPQL